MKTKSVGMASAAMAWVVVWSCGAGSAHAQFGERSRDVTVTGPGGRTIERKFHVERGPGFVDRQMQVVRPGGTLSREVQVQRMPGPGFRPASGWGRVEGFGPPWGGGGFVERDVIINNRGPGWLPALAVGGGLFGLGMLAGSAFASPPPPPMVVAPAPMIVAPVVPAPPPVVVYNPPQPYRAAPAPSATLVADPVADAIHRLRSTHNHSRRDGALALGRMGDARAVPALVDRLKNDLDKEVRVAAAWALGEIGDPNAAVSLQRAALFDRRREVRDAATLAYQRLPRPGEAGSAVPAATAGQAPSPARVPSSVVRSQPAQDTSSSTDLRSEPSLTPPPPPTPAESEPAPSRPAGTATGFPDSP